MTTSPQAWRRAILADRRLRGRAHAEFRRFQVHLLRDVFSKELLDDCAMVERILADVARRTFRAGRPGRCKDPIVTLAYDMRVRKKMFWPPIYRACGADTPEKQAVLRSAVRHRRVAAARTLRSAMRVEIPSNCSS